MIVPYEDLNLGFEQTAGRIGAFAGRDPGG
jgi:hypothetical protein